MRADQEQHEREQRASRRSARAGRAATRLSVIRRHQPREAAGAPAPRAGERGAPSGGAPAPVRRPAALAGVAGCARSRPGSSAAPRAVAGVPRRLVGARRHRAGPYICAMTPAEAPVGRLVVCPDADRQPRGRDAARARRAARGRRDRVRGHAPHARAARPPRHRRAPLVSFHEHNERARAGELVARMRGGRGRGARLRRRHAAGLRPGLRARAGVPRRGAPGRGAARAERRGRRRWSPPGLPAERWLLRRLPAAQARASSSGCWREPRRRSWRSSRRAASPATLGVLAELDPERPVAVCRELTKLHEEVRRGSAAELAAHYREHAAARRDRARGRRRRAGRAARATRRSRRCASSSTPARGRARRPRRVGEADGRRRQRALPRADERARRAAGARGPVA